MMPIFFFSYLIAMDNAVNVYVNECMRDLDHYMVTSYRSVERINTNNQKQEELNSAMTRCMIFGKYHPIYGEDDRYLSGPNYIMHPEGYNDYRFIKICYSDKGEEFLLSQPNRDISALSMNQNGTIIAAVNSRFLNLWNLSDDSNGPFYTYDFGNFEKNICFGIALNNTGNLAAVGGIYQKEWVTKAKIVYANYIYIIDVINDRLLYTIFLNQFLPQLLYFVDDNNLVVKFEEISQLYDLNKGKNIIDNLTQAQKEFITLISQKINNIRNQYYKKKHYNKICTISISEKDLQILETLSEETKEYIFNLKKIKFVIKD